MCAMHFNNWKGRAMYYYLFYTVSTPSDKNGEEERISDRMLNFGELSSDQAAVKKLKTFQEEETDFCG